MKRNIWLISLFFSASFCANAWSAVPQLVNYQGTLTDESGAAMATGDYDISVRMFTAATGGTAAWGPQTFPAVPVVKGYFNIILGTKDGAGKDIAQAFTGPSVFLEVTVKGRTIAPRQQVLSTPFSIMSDDSSLVKGRDLAQEVTLLRQQVSTVVQTVLSAAFTSTTRGSYVAIPGLSASISTISAAQRILVRACVVGWDSNNYPQYYHIYRDGAKITPNGAGTGLTPSDAYAVMNGGIAQGAGADQTTCFEYLDSPGAAGSYSYQVWVAKPTVAVSSISINAHMGGNSTVTLQLF